MGCNHHGEPATDLVAHFPPCIALQTTSMTESSLSETELAQARAVATKVLTELKNEACQAHPDSWIRQSPANEPDERSLGCRFFDYTGFLHVPRFCSTQECTDMKQEMKKLVDDEWNPNETLDSFGTDNRQNTARGDYFLESSNKIHFFAEPTALLEADETTGRQCLKEQYQNDKVSALNKAGHALHLQQSSGVFSSYCQSAQIRELVLDLGWQEPVVPQSMYIFKQAHHGGVVNSHQDSTFLFTTPKQSCLGLWLALDDATLENGCLWVRPKSHQEAVRRHYQRNPAHFGTAASQNNNTVAQGDLTQPKFVMETLYENNAGIEWDGDLPKNGVKGLLDVGFVPVECHAGDLLAFCGELDHLSLSNKSDKARHTFQLHLVEGPGAGVTWSPSNWLQYPDGQPFLRLLSS